MQSTKTTVQKSVKNATKKTVWRNTGTKLFYKERLRIVYQNDAGEYAVNMKVGQRRIYKRVPKQDTAIDPKSVKSNARANADLESESESDADNNTGSCDNEDDMDSKDPWSEGQALVYNPSLLDNYTALWNSQKKKKVKKIHAKRRLSNTNTMLFILPLVKLLKGLSLHKKLVVRPLQSMGVR